MKRRAKLGVRPHALAQGARAAETVTDNEEMQP